MPIGLGIPLAHAPEFVKGMVLPVAQEARPSGTRFFNQLVPLLWKASGAEPYSMGGFGPHRKDASGPPQGLKGPHASLRTRGHQKGAPSRISFALPWLGLGLLPMA